MLQGKYDEIRARCEAGIATNADALALLADNDDLADKLTDCWLLLDRVARTPQLSRIDAEELLRNQQAPGWKG